MIRKAKFSDVDWLLRHLKDFSDFYGSKHTLFPRQLEATKKILELIENHVALIYETESGEMAGFIVGTLTEHPFNSDVILLTELFWYVLKEHRGTKAAKELINRFTEIGKEKADWVIFGSVVGKTNVNPRSLARMGYRLNELCYLLEV